MTKACKTTQTEVKVMLPSSCVKTAIYNTDVERRLKNVHSSSDDMHGALSVNVASVSLKRPCGNVSTEHTFKTYYNHICQ